MKCVACNSQALEEVWTNLLRCKNCGTLQRPNLMEYYENIKGIYSENYFFERYKKRYGRDLSNDLDDLRKVAVRRIEIIENLYLRESTCYKCKNLTCSGCHVADFIKSQVKKKLLDVGCGSGIFLDTAKSRGFKVRGVDFNKYVLHLLPDSVRNDVVISNFFEYTTNEMFDVVTMFFVIEHLPNVEEVLKKVWGMLKRGGILAISTPNGRGFTASLRPKKYYSIIPEDHLYEFSLDGMIKLLERNGYKVRRVVNTGFHPERVTDSKLFVPFIGFYQHLIGLGDTFEVYAAKSL